MTMETSLNNSQTKFTFNNTISIPRQELDNDHYSEENLYATVKSAALEQWLFILQSNGFSITKEWLASNHVVIFYYAQPNTKMAL